MMSVIGDFWTSYLSEEEKNELEAEQAKRHSEFTKRLVMETDKAFDPICLPIAPVAPAKGRDNIEYKAMEEYAHLQSHPLSFFYNNQVYCLGILLHIYLLL